MLKISKRDRSALLDTKIILLKLKGYSKKKLIFDNIKKITGNIDIRKVLKFFLLNKKYIKKVKIPVSLFATAKS